MPPRAARLGALSVLLVAVLLAHSVRQRLGSLQLRGTDAARASARTAAGWAICTAPSERAPRIRIAAHAPAVQCLGVQDGVVREHGSREAVQAWCAAQRSDSGGACEVRELEVRPEGKVPHSSQR
jgi:hypothetical protein